LIAVIADIRKDKPNNMNLQFDATISKTKGASTRIVTSFICVFKSIGDCRELWQRR